LTLGRRIGVNNLEHGSACLRIQGFIGDKQSRPGRQYSIHSGREIGRHFNSGNRVWIHLRTLLADVSGHPDSQPTKFRWIRNVGIGYGTRGVGEHQCVIDERRIACDGQARPANLYPVAIHDNEMACLAEHDADRASRRQLCPGRPESVDGQIEPNLLRRALASLNQHQGSIIYRDFIGVADFSLPSSAPRFHLLDLAGGSVRSHLVAHGRGSDPAHTGWLERFSIEPRSNATSAGAYRTGSAYLGAHGRSMRLEGLDPTNSNALSRAIVVHGAWYVNEEMISRSGMLGRSQGCFAVADSSLPEIMARLAPGRLIYANKA